MKCGIIGLPNVGKSTLFNFISNKNKAEVKNFPFCTIDPNISIINVIDNRLKIINKIIKSKKIIYSTIKLIDIAGIIKGAHNGEGLGNRFLSKIRETNVIIHILRSFKDNNIIHVENNIDPIRDKEIVETELQLKDIETLKKYLKKINNNNKKEINFINKTISILNSGKNLRSYFFSDYLQERKILKNLSLLTNKPVIYLINIDKYITEKDKLIFNKLKNNLQKKEKIMFLTLKKEYLNKKDIYNIIRKIYSFIELENFFTVSKKEIRSWIMKKGTNTLQAAEIIHTDFKKGFIKAKVIHYKDYIKYKSEELLKKKGKIFFLGKNSSIKDGDIVHFIFKKN
ncbi:redox-regulated ATPase YchF [Candidatus Shikimatogenerans silvanidophilus]|uniref:redox-regulated ATPase YchF n=1 Tax=Candidatus Shikimatogenerans silvanidophilus TaxID=2782547 RepID=UPI001BAD883B|nr:redox-regulated ATPase YchF [Candidatus Shikimatogenerans silvanidophilus]